MLKLLVIGANGQLGTELRRLLETGSAEIGEIPTEYDGCEVSFADIDEIDITDAYAVEKFITSGKYEVVLNCAAMTNVDGCERNEPLAFAVNGEGPANLATACEMIGSKLVHVSTDYVFDGSSDRALNEDDAVGPVSAYGRSKLAGEKSVAELCERHFIVRTAWLYGYNGGNFVKTMVRLGSSHDEVTVVDDQYGSPTNANDLAYVILKLALTENYGIYHCTNNGRCSWADFAEKIMKAFDLPCNVKRCSSAEYQQRNPQSANRPAFSVLDNKHLRETIGDEMRDWTEAFDSYVSRYQELVS